MQLSRTKCDLYRGVETSHFETFLERIRDGGAQVFGHEYCGVIAETGDDVDEFTVGDRVLLPR